MDIRAKYRDVLNSLIDPYAAPKAIDQWHITLFWLPSFRPERIYDVHYEDDQGRLQLIQPATSVCERVLHANENAALQLPLINRRTKELNADSPIIKAVTEELPFRCCNVDRVGLDGETYRLVFTFSKGVHEAEVWEPFSIPTSSAWMRLIELLRTEEV